MKFFRKIVMPLANILLYFSLQFALGYPGATEISLCRSQVVHPTVPGTTKTWHLEVTGADLAKARLAENRNDKKVWSILLDSTSIQRPRETPTCMARVISTKPENLDEEYRNFLTAFDQAMKTGDFNGESGKALRKAYDKTVHPTLTLSAMAGSIGATADDSTIHSVAYVQVRKGTYAQALSSLKKELSEAFKTKPRVINISLTLSPEAANDLFKIADLKKNLVTVSSAGNKDRDLPEYLRKPGPLSGIVVGATTATGQQPEWSNYSPGAVLLYAPGEDVLVDKGLRAREVQASSGTSISAPIVSGSLVNIFSIYEALTAEDAIWLSNKTALPLKPRTEGKNIDPNPKQINSYLLYRVAERLQKNTESIRKKLGPAELSAIIRQTLESSKLYDFTAEASALRDEAQRISLSSCENRLKKITLLREAFLLNPNRSTKNELVASLNELGLGTLAEYFSNFNL